VDATRIYLASIATGADIKWNDLLIETYRNFANKIWNATRFCLLNAGDVSLFDSDAETTSEEYLRGFMKEYLADRWIVARLGKTILGVDRALKTYQFHEAVSLIYHFFWDDLCDWYIELKKDEISSGDEPSIRQMMRLLDLSLRLLHPFMPYLTEELWQMLPGTSSSMHDAAYADAPASIMLAEFPKPDWVAPDEDAERELGAVIELIKRVRNIRSEMNISPSIRFNVHVAAHEYFQGVFSANEAQIKKLARADSIVLGDSLDVPKASAKAVLSGGAEIAVPLEGLIDFDKERERLQNQIAKLDTELQRLNGQLSNANFVERAPAEKVQELRDRKDEIEQQTATLTTNLEALA
jgi:valyl-tRNA synthetase